MVESLVLALVAFGLGVAFGPRWLRFLRSRQLGKRLNPSEPQEHAPKQGTPTLGGVVFLAPVAAVTLAFQVIGAGRPVMLLPLALAAGCAALGALDDLQTLVSTAPGTGVWRATRQGGPVPPGARSAQAGGGLPPGVKLGAQVALCLAAGVALVWYGGTDVHVPLVGWFGLPAWAYVALATLVLLSTVFSVAITDGLDSLAASTSAMAFGAFWVVGLTLGYPSAAGLCGTIVGALLAYLWFNAYPAQMWMGDTGALALGGLLGMTALLEREPFLLLPVGIVFVANAASDILQVVSVKVRGRRLFRIAPLHSHFERLGWPETWVVQRYWITSALGALAGMLLAAQR